MVLSPFVKWLEIMIYWIHTFLTKHDEISLHTFDSISFLLIFFFFSLKEVVCKSILFQCQYITLLLMTFNTFFS